VTHVTTSQFEHQFEIRMQQRIRERLHTGILQKAASVKPNFSAFMKEVSEVTIINIAPNLYHITDPWPARDRQAVLVPLENTWRKNLYTNIIAAEYAESVDRVLTVNFPSELDYVFPMRKTETIGFQTPLGLLRYMASVGVVLNATFTECQPMAQLEALAVGTPCITGPLRLAGLSSHPLAVLCEVTELDDPGLLATKIERLIFEWRSDPDGLCEMTRDFCQRRLAAGLESYKRFFGWQE
jgi:glycosyltransferase involved in cell wall biosynthesis